MAHDLHPDYASTAYALEREGVELAGVQHHHAHLAACLAEHGLEGPAVGAIYDGSGYGTDGTIWGGEILVGDLVTFERHASLRPVRMPGGAAAIHEPWRMACAWLAAADGGPLPLLPASLADAVDPARWRQVARIGESPAVSPLTSSMGRLFDAVAALAGIRAHVSYEGQAAVELEALASAWTASPTTSRWTTWTAVASSTRAPRSRRSPATSPPACPRPCREALPRGRRASQPRAYAPRPPSGTALEHVVLSGGVFQNRLLLERTAALLAAAGLRPLVPERLPPNDGGIAYGQAAVAAARDRLEHAR